VKEAKNQAEQCLSEKLKEIEMMMREFDQVKKSCDVKFFHDYLLNIF